MKFKLLFVTILCLFSGLAQAADPAPLAMMKQTTNQLLAELKKHRGQLKGNSEIAYKIVKRVLLPNVDLDRMSRMVVGRTYWKQASSNTRNQFKNEFTRYVTKSYSTALEAYRDEKIKFFPIRGGIRGSRVKINSLVEQRGGPSISVSYHLVRNNNTWKVYDYSVEGVSMVKSYRSQFANSLSRGGLSNLVKELSTHNRDRR